MISHLKKASPFIFLLLLVFLSYVNILSNKLFYDDEELIYKNYYIQNLKFLPNYFTENMIAGAGKSSNMYRPILLASFAVDYSIWGNNPTGFHLTSIILHFFNSALIYIFLRKVFKNNTLAFFSSILFTVHPVHTEAVAYASGRTDLLTLLFILLGLISFISSILHKKQIKIGGVFFFYILALLSKETAIIFPFLLLLTSFVIYPESKKRHKTTLVAVSGLFIISMIYIFLRLTWLNFENTLNFYSQQNIYSQNLAVRIMTFSGVFFQYIRVFFFPDNLIFSRSATVFTSFLSPYFLIFFLSVCISLILSVYFWKKTKIIAFGLSWFFLSLLPVSGLIPINNIIAEHYLYLPSIGIFLIISFLIHKLWEKVNSTLIRTVLSIITVIIVLLLIGRTYTRNLDFKDALTFYEKSLSQNPKNIPMRHNLAMTYAESGDIKSAIDEYLTIIEKGDYYPQTHHNLANAYREIGDFQKAENEYKKAISMDENFLFSYYALLELYTETGNKEKAEALSNVIGNLLHQ